MVVFFLIVALSVIAGCAPVGGTPSQAEASAEELLAKIWREQRTHDAAWQELNAIEALGEDAAPVLISLIEKPINLEMENGQSCSDAEMKIGALVVLGRWQYEPAFELVENVTRAGESSIRPWGMVVLEQIDHARAYAVVVELANDADTQVREMVAKILRSYPEKDSCPFLRRLLADSQPFVRQEAGVTLLVTRICPEVSGWVVEAIAKEEHDLTKMILQDMLVKTYGEPSH